MAEVRHSQAARVRLTRGMGILLVMAWAAAVACASDSDTSEPDGSDAGIRPPGTGGAPSAASGGQQSTGGSPAYAGSPTVMGGSGGDAQNCLECHDVAWLDAHGIPPSAYQ